MVCNINLLVLTCVISLKVSITHSIIEFFVTVCYSQTSARFLHHHLDQDNKNFLRQDPRRPPLEIPELMQAQNGMRKAPNSPCWVSFDNKVMIWQFLRTT